MNMTKIDLTPEDVAFLLPFAQHRVTRLRNSIKTCGTAQWQKASPKYRDWANTRIADCQSELPAAEALLAKLTPRTPK
jgi:hypothetical protein